MPTDSTRPTLSITPLTGYEPAIGRWLWALEDIRHEIKQALDGLDPALIDWTPAPAENSIGTLLYHIGLIELDWLYTEALGNRPIPSALKALFPFEDRDEQHLLSVIRNTSLEEHLHRLDVLRTHLLASFREMSLAEFQQLRAFPDYDVTPEWVLYHLIQHEGEHLGHIQTLRSQGERILKA